MAKRESRRMLRQVKNVLVFTAVLWCSTAALETQQLSAQAAAEPTAIEKALLQLSRVPSDARLFTYGVASGPVLKIVAEIASAEIAQGRWAAGAEVQVTGTGAGAAAEMATGRIEPGTRAVIVTLPHRSLGPGPWKLAVRVKQGELQIDGRLDIAPGESTPLLDAALAFRGTPAPQAPLRPVADFQYRRTERLHIEWPLSAALDRRTARLLDRRGQPIAVEVAVTDRADGGAAVLVADVNLAPLNAGDYVLDVTAARGADQQRALVAFRVVR
jgi:hypothetical protein